MLENQLHLFSRQFYAAKMNLMPLGSIITAVVLGYNRESTVKIFPLPFNCIVLKELPMQNDCKHHILIKIF